MFDLSYSLVIGSFFLEFVLFVALSKGSVAMALCVRIEYPNVEKCTLPVFTPKTFGYNIEPRSIFTVGSSVEKMFT